MRPQIYILPETDREKIIERLARFCAVCLPGKQVQVKVERYVRTRSLSQSNALYGVAYKVIREATGYELHELHDYFCRAFFGEVEREVMGKVYTRPRRTTTTNEQGERDVITTLVMMDFYSFIQTHAAEHLGIDVPDPDPHWRENMRRQAEREAKEKAA